MNNIDRNKACLFSCYGNYGLSPAATEDATDSNVLWTGVVMDSSSPRESPRSVSSSIDKTATEEDLSSSVDLAVGEIFEGNNDETEAQGDPGYFSPGRKSRPHYEDTRG